MDLDGQIGFLKARLLNTVSSQFPDPLSNEDQVAVSSFLVLAHASVEEALEDAFLSHFETLVQFTIADSVPVGLARIFFGLRLAADRMVANQGPLDTRAIGEICLAVFKKDYIGQNNGLKLENVKKLASGAGLYWPDLEDALNPELSDLTTLGTKRGSVGHLSPFTLKPVAITTSTDPSDVLRWVENGVAAVGAIVAYLRKSREAGVPLSLICDWDGN